MVHDDPAVEAPIALAAVMYSVSRNASTCERIRRAPPTQAKRERAPKITT